MRSSRRDVDFVPLRRPCASQPLIDRNIKVPVSQLVFTFFFLLVSSLAFSESGLGSPVSAQVWVTCTQGERRHPTGPMLPESYLLDIHYRTLFAPFICSLFAALNINYRGTLQLDISSFTLYLKQHAATSKRSHFLSCCRKKELQ